MTSVVVPKRCASSPIQIESAGWESIAASLAVTGDPLHTTADLDRERVIAGTWLNVVTFRVPVDPIRKHDPSPVGSPRPRWGGEVDGTLRRAIYA